MRNGQAQTVGQREDISPRTTHYSMVMASIPFAQRLTCTIAEACEATGLGRTKLYELIGKGCLETTTIDRRRLILVRSLLCLLKIDNP